MTLNDSELKSSNSNSNFYFCFIHIFMCASWKKKQSLFQCLFIFILFLSCFNVLKYNVVFTAVGSFWPVMLSFILCYGSSALSQIIKSPSCRLLTVGGRIRLTFSSGFKGHLVWQVVIIALQVCCKCELLCRVLHASFFSGV